MQKNNENRNVIAANNISDIVRDYTQTSNERKA